MFCVELCGFTLETQYPEYNMVHSFNFSNPWSSGRSITSINILAVYHRHTLWALLQSLHFDQFCILWRYPDPFLKYSSGGNYKIDSLSCFMGFFPSSLDHDFHFDGSILPYFVFYWLAQSVCLDLNTHIRWRMQICSSLWDVFDMFTIHQITETRAESCCNMQLAKPSSYKL